MAKKDAKISKHSRAARRGLIRDVGEARDLELVPKVDGGEIKKTIIRNTISNENLLNRKMENSRIRKHNKKKTSALVHKVERNQKLGGVLITKIEQSITRARYIQGLRKAGWDQINKSIVIKNHLKEEDNAEDNEWEDIEDGDDIEDESKVDGEVSAPIFASANKYALLDIEA